MAITDSIRHLEVKISTLFEKLDDAQRNKIDAAIIGRDPATLTKLHEKFQLAEKGVSYQVLSRYARKIRDGANQLSLLESSFPGEIDIADHLKNQIGRICIDLVLNNENPTALDVHRAALAYHKCLRFSKTLKETQLLGEPKPSAGRKDEREKIEAPWGRRPDGAPRTHQEFCADLNQLMHDIYGINPPSPAHPSGEAVPSS